ncbi:uncharacterized protein LOC112595602 [Melanaphis sacchari]|uniref:uncharacterized protein LOC112595602 n=1 Tax=Melanaphis sacchari TaxID=742174 RepID=UPI000DC14404|nr:uncharacterized protein LOC112595602 [Melanaphis sacchari]
MIKQLKCLIYPERELLLIYAKIPKTQFNLLVSIIHADRVVYSLSLCVLKILLHRFKMSELHSDYKRRRTSRKYKTLRLRKIRRSRFIKVSDFMDFLRNHINILYKQMYVRYTSIRLRSRGRLIKNSKLFALLYFFK